MGDQYSVSGNEKCEQIGKNNNVNRVSIKPENYRNFFNLIRSNDNLDLDADLDIDAGENTHTMKRV